MKRDSKRRSCYGRPSIRSDQTRVFRISCAVSAFLRSLLVTDTDRRGVPLAGAAEPDAARVLHPRRMRRAKRASAVVRTTKQYLLHHGFPGRLSTTGNVAFPFTPPELAGTTAYRFCVYHVMDVDALAPLFPVTVEDL